MIRIISVLFLCACTASAQPMFCHSRSWWPQDAGAKAVYDARNMGTAKSSGDTSYLWRDLAGNYPMYAYSSTKKGIVTDSSGYRFVKCPAGDNYYYTTSSQVTSDGTNFTFAAYVRFLTRIAYGGCGGIGNTAGGGRMNLSSSGTTRALTLQGKAELGDGASTLNWEAIICTHSSSTNVMYVNGSSNALSASSANNPTGGMYVGPDYVDKKNNLARFVFYDKVPSAYEITLLNAWLRQN